MHYITEIPENPPHQPGLQNSSNQANILVFCRSRDAEERVYIYF